MHSSLVTRHLSLVTCHSSLVTCHSSLVIRHSSLVTRHSSFVTLLCGFCFPLVLFEPGEKVRLLQHAVRRSLPAVKFIGHAHEQGILLQQFQRAIELLALPDGRA